MPRILDRLRRRPMALRIETREHQRRARRIARRLSRAIDDAMARGLMTRADILARRATRMSASNPRLAECVARLRLAQNRPELALRVIEASTRKPSAVASLRLLRVTCMVQAGRQSDAHTDLLRWTEQSSAPPEARLMLGLLEWRRGDTAAALRAWRATLRRIDDPPTLAALVATSAHRNRPRQVELWAQRLRATESPEADLILQSLGLAGCGAPREHRPEQVNALALELIGAEAAIGPLVEVQRLQPHAPIMRLLRDAIAEAFDELRERAAACEALAYLSLALGDRADAARWADAGLRANPMSAALTIFAAELAGETPAAQREKAA